MPGQPRAVAFPSRLLAPLVFSSSQGEGMKVQFEFTPADLAEVGRRAVNRSPMVHRWRLMNSLSVAILVEVELTSAGVVSRQLGQESLHPWPQVASVAEVPGGIEFVYRPIGSLLVRDRAFRDSQARADFLSTARGFVPAGAEPAPASKSVIPEETLAAGPTEGDYFVAWLLFFLCVSISTSLASSAIDAGSAAIFRTSGSSPLPAVYVIAGISFLLSAGLSYVFFPLFTKRLVSRLQARRTLVAT